MNKIVFLFSAAALALASCSQEEVVNDMAQNNAIEFGTYAGRPAQTRGSVVGGDDFTFGVFAYYTGQKNWTTSEAPDFMFNQKVTKSPDACTYTPVKYWPNNPEDKVTFFAYAPYNEALTTAPGAAADDSKLKISHTVENAVKDQTDLLYSINFHKDLTKKTVSDDDRVKFTFAHALSRIGFSATCAVDQVPAGGTLADGTTITITEVVVSGAVTKTTTNNLVEYTYSGIFYKSGNLFTTVPDQSTVDVTASWENEAGEQHFTLNTNNFLDDELSGSETIAQLNNDDSYLMVIPQNFTDGFYVTVTYTVTTTDDKNSANSSVIPNTITTKVTDLNLAMGNAYTLNLVLGMTSVKVNAEVANWETPEVSNVPVPVNKN